MILNNIISIDFQNQLNEKHAKELITSLERLFIDISKKVEFVCEKTHKDISFIISFDNGNNFYITSKNIKNKIETTISYINYAFASLSILSLQDALNINKYTYEIEQFIQKSINDNNYNIKAFYTEQNIHKKFPIYKEKEPGMKYNIHIDAENIDR